MSEGLKPAVAALTIAVSGMFAQSPAARPTFDAFEVATIKPTPPDYQGGRFIAMQSAHLFGAKNYTLKSLVGATYNLTPRGLRRPGMDRCRPLRHCRQDAKRNPAQSRGADVDAAEASG